MGQGKKWPKSLPLTLHWGGLSLVAILNHKGAWEILICAHEGKNKYCWTASDEFPRRTILGDGDIP